MKKIITGFAAFLLIINMQVNAFGQVVKSNIKEVTVFQQGAQIFRTGSVLLNEGVNEILFTDLPQNIDQRSIQVSGTGNFSILSVNHQINYLKTQVESKEVKILTDSLKMLESIKDEVELGIEICQQEESALLANKVIGGTQNGVSTEALKIAMNYFQTKLTDIKNRELKFSRELKIIDEKIVRIQNQLNSLRSIKKEPTSEVLIVVNAAAKTNAKLNLSYVIYNAGWYPEYDIRAVSIKDPIDFVYKAKVFQSSGKNWENVKLSISTGNPMVRGDKPIIYPWYLNFYEAYSNSKIMLRGVSSVKAPTSVAEANDIVEFEMEEKVSEADYSSFVQTTNQTNVEFKIDVPYTIPSNGKAQVVQINEYQLNATYTYYSAPKINTDAFLLAKITGWAEYSLLPGQANIFFEGTFVGNSSINPTITQDTLDLSLGRDQSIVITRTKIKDFESKKLLGVNKKETFGWEISVRNNKNAGIAIIIEDQFPISKNKEIEVEQIEKSNARLNETLGKLTWEMNLNPQETKKVQIKYSVKYPKDRIVQID
ncbi:MAG: DUF4139 domain-containing protein [Bacteroidales bacterium]